ncbi:MAG: HAMP domain-containing protein [Firmicutes bacterium]|nr:HAMP domain-containing protein [Bacillota bacterium]
MIIAVTGIISLISAANKTCLSVTEQTKQIASGDYSLRPENTANSLELYELAQAVETMADELDKQEKLRDDVAHELRTPLTNIASC